MSSEPARSAATVASLGLDEFRELIRQVLREELPAILEECRGYAGPTVIEPGSPVYQDLEELLRLKESGDIELLSYEQVFGEGNDVSP